MGEQLLIRLWDTLAEKGVGGLLSPLQIRRVGKAQTDVECERIERIAQAKKNAQDIRAGRISAHLLLSGPDSTQDSLPQSAPIRREPTFETPLQIASRNAEADAIDREVNVAKAILHAEDALRDDPQPPPEDRVDTDWLNKWRLGAGEVSSETLQQLWGRLLAGEVRSPGRYSLRCLGFLRDLTSKEAQDIARLGPYAVSRFIWREKQHGWEGIEDLNLDFLMKMQSWGILSGTEGSGVSIAFLSVVQDKFSVALKSNQKLLVVQHEDPTKRLEIPCALLTDLGQEILSLGVFEPNMDYLRRLGRFFAAKGFSVILGDYKTENERIRLFNEEPITADHPQAA